MSATATPQDVAVALGRTAPAQDSTEFAQWAMWISDAEMLIKARLGDLEQVDRDALRYVVREAVVAQVRRPDDATQVSVTVDEGSTSRTYRSSKGRVTIIDEWWELLSPKNTSRGAFSINPYGASSSHLLYCSLGLGASYCSCGADIAGHPIFELPADELMVNE